MLAGDPARPTAHESAIAGIAELAQQIAAEKDHVSAVELAGWIRDRKDGLRVVDVRSTAEPGEPMIPTAEAIELTAVTTTPFQATDTIVLYSAEGVHAGQAWVLLRAMGYRAVFFLRGGWAAWHEEIMHPTLEEGASIEAQTAFAHTAELSRYFGGVPRIVPAASRKALEGAPPSAKEPRSAPTPPRKRGC